MVEEECDIDIKEFSVAGITSGERFRHHWYFGTDDPTDTVRVKECLDRALRQLNDDYGVERDHALDNPQLDIIPSRIFYDWMRQNGKEGGQNKFPRVMKNTLLENWKDYLESVRVT